MCGGARQGVWRAVQALHSRAPAQGAVVAAGLRVLSYTRQAWAREGRSSPQGRQSARKMVGHVQGGAGGFWQGGVGVSSPCIASSSQEKSVVVVEAAQEKPEAPGLGTSTLRSPRGCSRGRGSREGCPPPVVEAGGAAEWELHEFCCGVGSMSVQFEALGVQVVQGCDTEEWARKVFAARHPVAVVHESASEALEAATDTVPHVEQEERGACEAEALGSNVDDEALWLDPDRPPLVAGSKRVLLVLVVLDNQPRFAVHPQRAGVGCDRRWCSVTVAPCCDDGFVGVVCSLGITLWRVC